MHKAAAIFLAVALTLPFWVKGVVLLHFLANRAYIVEHFCENKGKPQLHCDGKCYLHKQLKNAEPSERDANTPPVAHWLHKWELSDFDLPARLFEMSARFGTVRSPFLPCLEVVLRGFPGIPDKPPNGDEPV